ncbi:hypothetical protein BOTCAL_0040g00030 [Botryotinia calthae]|uniref:Uncharacterized protein n=1 Tax=Botryotinia calthae TaxID=38488 RepID=A0A4Y8DC32_9HELO|nr:hypothetical protein BOTCAL_0040g00030 [Botryotinia calthae]
MDLQSWIAKWGKDGKYFNAEREVEEKLFRKRNREQHVAHLLASNQIEAPKQPEACKQDDILQLKSLLPLHQDPAQYFERLSVVLMFRTRFSTLTRRQQNDYSWGLESVPLLEMFGREFLKNTCKLYGVELGRLQQIVNEMWMDKMFSPSSSLTSELQKFTDEDLVSDWFRTTIRLPILNKDGLISANQSSPLKSLSTNERLPKPRENLIQSPKAAAQKPNPPSNVAQPKVCGRSPRPTKSLYMNMISSTSKHGGKSNVYNPSALRRPKGAPAPVQNDKAAQPTNVGSRSISVPKLKDFTTSRRYSTSDAPPNGEWKSLYQSQCTRPKPRSKSFSEGPSISRNGAPNYSLSAPEIRQYVSYESLRKQKPEQKTPDIWAGARTVSASSQNPNAMLDTPSIVIPNPIYDEDSMEIDGPVFPCTENTSPASSQIPTGLTNDNVNYFDDGDAMDLDDDMNLDIPLSECQRRPSLTRHQKLLKSARRASETGSVATSSSSIRRSPISNKSPSTSDVMNAMKINHSKVVRSLRKARRSPPSPQDAVTK